MRFDRDYQEKILFKSNTHIYEVEFTNNNLSVIIYHKLKRKPQKWTVCNVNAPIIVYGEADAEKIVLNSTGVGKATIEVV